MTLATTEIPRYLDIVPSDAGLAASDGACAALREEARVFGRFIAGGPVEHEFVERYVAAHAHLPIEVRDAADERVLTFAVAHPAALPALDAASALVWPHSLLHRKALLMAAILEASPRYADDFLPRRSSWGRLVLLVVSVGLSTAYQVARGLPLLLVLRAVSSPAALRRLRW